MGTPEFAVPSLRAVAGNFCDLVGVVTQPDRPRGRGRATAESPVAEAARKLGFEALKPEKVNTPEWIERLKALEPELFAVVAYGAILKPALLAVPRLGAVNLHGSMLPDYRGASPVQRALWDGRATTGVTTIRMDAGIDTGAMLAQLWAPIEAADNAATLAERLSELGAPLLVASLGNVYSNGTAGTPQPAGGSYAPRLAKSDGLIDWELDAETIWNHQRAVTPWPGAATRFRDARIIITASSPWSRMPCEQVPGAVVTVARRALYVACGLGMLRVIRLKPEGRAEMDAYSWANGVRCQPGERFEPLETTT